MLNFNDMMVAVAKEVLHTGTAYLDVDKITYVKDKDFNDITLSEFSLMCFEAIVNGGYDVTVTKNELITVDIDSGEMFKLDNINSLGTKGFLQAYAPRLYYNLFIELEEA